MFLPPSVRNERIYLSLNFARSDDADLGQSHMTIAIHHNQGGHSPHTENDCGLLPYPAHHIEPDHLSFTI
jgi:hypothetical protein